jgi:hypothetical protein
VEAAIGSADLCVGLERTISLTESFLIRAAFRFGRPPLFNGDIFVAFLALARFRGLRMLWMVLKKYAPIAGR